MHIYFCLFVFGNCEWLTLWQATHNVFIEWIGIKGLLGKQNNTKQKNHVLAYGNLRSESVVFMILCRKKKFGQTLQAYSFYTFIHLSNAYHFVSKANRTIPKWMKALTLCYFEGVALHYNVPLDTVCLHRLILSRNEKRQKQKHNFYLAYH